MMERCGFLVDEDGLRPWNNSQIPITSYVKLNILVLFVVFTMASLVIFCDLYCLLVPSSRCGHLRLLGLRSPSVHFCLFPAWSGLALLSTVSTGGWSELPTHN
ncbi:hypothetical protein HRR83_007961 [Exophiala dermatitidis]|nr:hypothetical protein HRR82_007535 [Exophiala dermatitidis]KAJ4574595.1 hypothetical protein HRR81_004499 [Exophiala dermatitidis]KAJ4589284.1 hypothetical protein HRR83_007961 [Exophiala dermatitidis]KAJ4606523.1 hypothetical protein HRR85_007292 [Exophiala dermatitidis]KAJ4632819.1 hypothetical protein HRR86_001956 [Exophiala dermatitidis]